jgi:hypothetical protein
MPWSAKGGTGEQKSGRGEANLAPGEGSGDPWISFSLHLFLLLKDSSQGPSDAKKKACRQVVGDAAPGARRNFSHWLIGNIVN